MRGSVIKRGKSWSVVVELPPDPETGKRRQRWHSGYRTRKEAERARVELLSIVDSGTYVDHNRETLAQFIADWLPAIERTIRPATLHSYERNLRLHVTPYIGALPLPKIDAGVLNGLYARLLKDGRRDRQGGLSPRTVRYVHTILHRALKDGTKWGRIARNPADAANAPRAAANAAPEMTTWTAGELRIFLEQNAEDRLYAAWLLLATTGMRRGEALGLRWADLDFETGRAAIRQTVVMVGKEVIFGTPKTAKGRRVIALDTATVAGLRAHRARQLEERLLIGAGWQDLGLAFSKVTGEPLHPDRFSREFDRRVKRSGLPRIRLHDLRHTWATLALQAGVHPKVVQERLGHSAVGITLDVYSHAIPAMQADAAEKVAGLVLDAER
ncbi:MAG: site-specific integrase [Actinomycetota bacterium]|nr:site-specific integrase [Actinomycetota bacterium]